MTSTTKRTKINVGSHNLKLDNIGRPRFLYMVMSDFILKVALPVAKVTTNTLQGALSWSAAGMIFQAACDAKIKVLGHK